MAKATRLSDQDRKMVDVVMGLVLFGVGVVLLAWGFVWLLNNVLPSLTWAGAEVVVGALAFGLGVAVFRVSM